MAVYITAVHFQGGPRHEHIAKVQWAREPGGAAQVLTREQVIDWIRHMHGEALVTDGTNTVSVGVWDARPPYLRTYADGKWTDNLLALPQF